MCYFSFILFPVGTFLAVYGMTIMKYLKRRHWIPKSYKTLAKWHLSETCFQSVCILGSLEYITVLITKILYEVGMNNNYVVMVMSVGTV